MARTTIAACLLVVACGEGGTGTADESSTSLTSSSSIATTDDAVLTSAPTTSAQDASGETTTSEAPSEDSAHFELNYQIERARLAVGADHTWVLDLDFPPVDPVRILGVPSSGEEVIEIEISGHKGRNIAFGFESVWLTTEDAEHRGVLHRVDPATAEVTATLPLGDAAIGLDMQFTEEFVVIQSASQGTRAEGNFILDDGELIIVNPSEMEVVERFDPTGREQRVAVVGETLWTTDFNTGQVVGLDLEGNEFARLATGPRPWLAADDVVWTLDDTGLAIQIDPSDGSVVRQIEIGVWEQISVAGNDLLLEGGTFVDGTSGALETLDIGAAGPLLVNDRDVLFVTPGGELGTFRLP